MTLRTRLAVAGIWLLSLVAVGSLTYAQAPRIPSNPGDLPNMLTGPDIGFVVEDQKGGVVFGQLMVRIDGQWRTVVGSRSPRGFLMPVGE